MVAQLAAPRPVDQVDDLKLFETTYSPRKIAFLLTHFEELTALVETPSSSLHVSGHMDREWRALQDRPGVCLCQADFGTPACAEVPRNGRHFKAANIAALAIHADLLTAANALPAGW